MNYFASCLYGDYGLYKRIKSCLEESDHLYIIGDVLDGNEDAPEEGLEILSDIMESEDVTLVLGDHEFSRVMEYVSKDDAKAAEEWRDYSNALSVSGVPLNEYMDECLDPEKRDEYIGSFLIDCELSAVVPIGGRYFYLVHGCPTAFAEQMMLKCQLSMVERPPSYRRSPWRSIATDAFVEPYRGGKNPMGESNTIAIVGQTSEEEAAETLGIKPRGDGFLLSNGILAIGRRGPGDPLTLIGVDAVGIVVKGVFEPSL